MAITIARVQKSGDIFWCRVDGDALHRLDITSRSTAELLALGAAGLHAAPTIEVIAVSEVEILSPVTRPGNIICQGLNYFDHSSESGHASRRRNLLFAKAPSSVSGPFTDVVRPVGCKLLDYEVELGLVLSKPLAFDTVVTTATISEFVGGMVVCNDISARDVMFGAAFLQWFRGKSGRTFSPCGPWLLIPEEGDYAALLQKLEVRLYLNDELRQHAFTRDMIFKPHECLTDVATFMELEPGDLVMTGTPGGVITQGTPGIAKILATKLFDDEARYEEFVTEALSEATYLQPGDVVRTEISAADGTNLGTQRFGIVDG